MDRTALFRATICLLVVFFVPFRVCDVFGQIAEATESPEASALLKEGRNALAAERFSDAEKLFKKAAKLEHDHCVRCYFGLAEAKISLGDESAAIANCDRALAVASNDKQRAEIHELRGDILLRTADIKKIAAAEAEYRASLQLDASQPIYHLKLAMALFKQSRDVDGQQELTNYLQLAPAGENASFAKRLAANPRRARENYAPELQLATLQGPTLSLADLAGRVVVLDFWATWCPPCRESVPELKDMSHKYSRDKLVVISISADQDEHKWREFVAKKNMDWAQYWDKDGRVRRLMNVHAFPTYLVIDPEGVIRERIVGMNPQETIVHRLRDKLQTMLPQG